ncbi:MAG: hypothetical protein AAF750_12620 [Planctomycetota bacterium]
MISVSLIDRCLIKNDHDRLLRELARNGLVIPLPLRVRLASAPTAAKALGLRRLSELTYSPTPQARRLAQQLLDAQHPLGSFLPDPKDRSTPAQPCPLTTATVLAALQRVAQDLRDDSMQQPLQQARRLGTQALARMQHADGLFTEPTDRTIEDRQLTSAFIAYLLATDALFRESIDFWSLAKHFDGSTSGMAPETAQLWAMAQLSETPTLRSPASAKEALQLAAA